MLHYVPVDGELRRGAQVFKMRGSDHGKSVREFRITDHGMEVGDPCAEVSQLF